MKKKVLSCILATALSVTMLAGCGNGDGGNSGNGDGGNSGNGGVPQMWL